MKKSCVKLIMCTIMLFTMTSGKAQNLVTEVKAKVIPMSLDITNRKTTNLIFPYAIKSVDRGSKEVLVQKAKGVENILQIKSASDTLRETNLTVVCSDGTLYSFNVRYLANPTLLNLSLGRVIQQTPQALFAPNENNDAKIYDLAAQLTAKKQVIKNIKDHKDQITMRCNGIYIRDDIFYFQLFLENSSNINYTIDQLKFSIRDQKKPKRTASQEIPLEPLYISGNAAIINSASDQAIVVAMPKFTIPDQKILIVQMTEKDGGRNLSIRVSNNQLIYAVQVN
jgi:conjugative transposon TraN protein